MHPEGRFVEYVKIGAAEVVRTKTRGGFYKIQTTFDDGSKLILVGLDDYSNSDNAIILTDNFNVADQYIGRGLKFGIRSNRDIKSYC